MRTSAHRDVARVLGFGVVVLLLADALALTAHPRSAPTHVVEAGFARLGAAVQPAAEVPSGTITAAAPSDPAPARPRPVRRSPVHPGSSEPAPTIEPAPDPGFPPPPLLGDYHFATEVIGGRAPGRSETDVRVSPAPGRSETTYRITSAYQGLVSTEVVSWSPQSLVTERTTFTGSLDFDCDWHPEPVELQAPLVIDASWAVATSCSNPEQTWRLARSGRSRVARITELSVAGRLVRAWVIAAVEDVTIDGPGVSGTERITSERWVSTGRAMVVYSNEHIHIRRGSTEEAQTVIRSLQSGPPV